jgi:hypothetical protein
LEYERQILSTCKDKLQFFDQRQYLDLERLKEDRHQCAHPSFQRAGQPYIPSAEQARLHLRNAIVHVLSQPPVQGKAAISELKVLVASNYFPTKIDLAVAQLRASSLNGGTEALIKGFIDALIFGFFEKGDALFFKQQVVSALNACQVIYPAISEPKLRKQLNKIVRNIPDEMLQGAIFMVASTENAWALLEDPARNKFVEYLRRAPGSEVIKVLNPLSKLADLRSEILNRVNKLTYSELATAISEHRLGEFAKHASLNFVFSVRSWAQANDVINRLIVPIFETLDKSDIERIIRAPTEHASDLLGATAYETFIQRVRLGDMFTEEELNGLLRDNGASYLVPRFQQSET